MRASRRSCVLVIVPLAALFAAGFHHIAAAIEHAVQESALSTAVAGMLVTPRVQRASDAAARHLPAVERSCAACHIASHVEALPRFRSVWYAVMQALLRECDPLAATAHCVERAQCRPR